MVAFAQFQLSASIVNPTSLQFGPDGRLYVSEVDGTIKAFTIGTTSSGGYTVTATETIDLVAQMPNHNDDGTFNPNITGRQVTGILVSGTAANPVIYVSSSDPRIGAGTSHNDSNLDTNSGTLSRLTLNGSSWVKQDLVVGLPRSEENHAVNGMQIDPVSGHLMLTVGGTTNAGAPSANFANLPEYAYSSSIVSIDLAAIDAMPSISYRGQTIKYVLPTVNDPTRSDANGVDVVAAGQPEVFGGNDGLNQARLTANSPVQIYATGFRNIYDIAYTEGGKLYGIDNGGNPTWGGPPIYRQANGTFSTTPTDDVTNRTNNGTGSVNQAPLHWITQDYYGGHPNPIRANPDGAGLWDASNNPISGLPSDWPPVPLSMANPVEGYYLPPGQSRADRLPSNLETPLNLRSELTAFLGSVNGVDDYRSNAFAGEMRGDLVAASLNEDAIYWVNLSADGQSVLGVTNITPNGVLGAGTALDVHAAPENGPFAGTLWVASYGGGITVLTPTTDAPPPQSNDADGDGLNDAIDRFAVDPNNGKTTVLQGGATLTWGFSQNEAHPGPAESIHNIGFTGVMTNLVDSYKLQYDPTRVVAGGAASGVLLQNITEGSAHTNNNTQTDAYQFGVDIAPNVDTFVITTTLDNPFNDIATKANYQNAGFFIGTGDQATYVKIVAEAGTLNGKSNQPEIELVYESNNQVVAQQKIGVPVFGGSLPLTPLDNIKLTLTVDPDTGSVTPGWTVTRGVTAESSGTIFTGSGNTVQVTGPLLQALQGTYTVPTGTGTSLPSALAVGLISTSIGPGAPFAETWNSISITSTAEAPTAGAGAARLTMTPGGDIDVSTFGSNTIRLENLATSGSNLTQVKIDLNGAILPDGIFFDPASAGGSSGKPFSIDSKVGSFTASASYADGSNATGFRQLVLNLNDFNPGETLGFSIDIDPDSMRGFSQSVNPGGISGAEAAGSRITYVFADGSQQVAELFGSGVAQAEAVGRSSLAAAPTLTVAGVSSGNVAVPAEDTNVLVTGAAGSVVRVQVMAVDQQFVTSSDPYWGNSATAVTYQTVTLDAQGRATVPVDLLPDQVTVVAAAVVNAQGVAISAASAEVNIIHDDSGQPPSGPTIAINTGGSAYTDADTGLQYVADMAAAPHPDLVGTTTARTITSAIAGTNDDALFQSYRYGKDFGYAVDLSNGAYTVELQFIEPFFKTSGTRKFDVHLEGQEVASDVDVFAAAGGKNIAYTIVRDVTVTDGQLNVGLESTGADDRDNAILTGIVVRPQATGAVLAAADLLALDDGDIVAVDTMTGARSGTSVGEPATLSDPASSLSMQSAHDVEMRPGDNTAAP
jgi:malectin (di-glucose binding ER protein)